MLHRFPHPAYLLLGDCTQGSVEYTRNRTHNPSSIPFLNAKWLCRLAASCSICKNTKKFSFTLSHGSAYSMYRGGNVPSEIPRNERRHIYVSFYPPPSDRRRRRRIRSRHTVLLSAPRIFPCIHRGSRSRRRGSASPRWKAVLKSVHNACVFERWTSNEDHSLEATARPAPARKTSFWKCRQKAMILCPHKRGSISAKGPPTASPPQGQSPKHLPAISHSERGTVTKETERTTSK